MGEARRMGPQRRCCSTGVGACWGSPTLFFACERGQNCERLRMAVGGAK